MSSFSTPLFPVLRSQPWQPHSCAPAFPDPEYRVSEHDLQPIEQFSTSFDNREHLELEDEVGDRMGVCCMLLHIGTGS